MGYVSFQNDPFIPEEKRPELAQRVMTILEHGGMMGIDLVEIYGKRVVLLKPLSPNEDGKIIFRFNYYEDALWEDAVYSVKNAKVISFKIGFKQFAEVICAVYALVDFYANGAGIPHRDGKPMELGFYAGWLNHLFHEKFMDTEEEISTVDFLMTADLFGRDVFTDDDRAYLWRPGGDIHLSQGMMQWLAELRAEMTDIVEKSVSCNTLKVMMDALDEAEDFGHLYAFREMFYDFLAHPDDPKRQAAVMLLWRMVEREKAGLPSTEQGGWFAGEKKRRCPARLRVKRFLAVLGNLELRREVFGF